MKNEATLQGYLYKKLPQYIRELTEKNGNPEEYESLLSIHSRELCYGNEDISMAYDMGIPRHTLYRFGYTDEEIDDYMDEMYSNVTYPK